MRIVLRALGLPNWPLGLGSEQGRDFGPERRQRELTRCGELAGRCSEVVEAIEKQLGFQGLVWPQPGARQGSLGLP